ncbi:hypothetical protein [Streptomyces seoulensis]|uniref:hypothetical protein n=1 Tax=Streptomyces seoulensis TaxID=73044 RepID=UPI001FCA927A|nr:hypothetical protein [Streptomyces seoulensis]BDH05785.1 hypothetical protein HEK131_30120 [Streptomyces seoulensis]
MNAGAVITLAAFSPIIVPLWAIAAGLFSIRIGSKAKSLRLGWLFFLTLGLLPVAATFALLGAIAPLVVVGIIACMIIALMILDWYGDRTSEPDSVHDRTPGGNRNQP